MNASERIEHLRDRLNTGLAPVSIEIEDQSHLHAGHAGAREGKGHFRVVIVATAFAGLSPIKCHRLVYDAVGDLLETDIHALTIEARTP
jgi:BolA protein